MQLRPYQPEIGHSVSATLLAVNQIVSCPSLARICQAHSWEEVSSGQASFSSSPSPFYYGVLRARCELESPFSLAGLMRLNLWLFVSTAFLLLLAMRLLVSSWLIVATVAVTVLFRNTIVAHIHVISLIPWASFFLALWLLFLGAAFRFQDRRVYWGSYVWLFVLGLIEARLCLLGLVVPLSLLLARRRLSFEWTLSCGLPVGLFLGTVWLGGLWHPLEVSVGIPTLFTLSFWKPWAQSLVEQVDGYYAGSLVVLALGGFFLPKNGLLSQSRSFLLILFLCTLLFFAVSPFFPVEKGTGFHQVLLFLEPIYIAAGTGMLLEVCHRLTSTGRPG